MIHNPKLNRYMSYFWQRHPYKQWILKRFCYLEFTIESSVFLERLKSTYSHIICTTAEKGIFGLEELFGTNNLVKVVDVEITGKRDTTILELELRFHSLLSDKQSHTFILNDFGKF